MPSPGCPGVRGRRRGWAGLDGFLPHPPARRNGTGIMWQTRTGLIFHSPPPPALFHTISETFPFLPTLLFEEASWMR